MTRAEKNIERGTFADPMAASSKLTIVVIVAIRVVAERGRVGSRHSDRGARAEEPVDHGDVGDINVLSGAPGEHEANHEGARPPHREGTGCCGVGYCT